MKRELVLSVAAVTLLGMMAPAVYADSYTETSRTMTNEIPVGGTSVTTESNGATVIESTPAVVAPVETSNTTIIKEKKKRHHLLKVPFVSVF